MNNYTEKAKQIYNKVCDKYNHHWSNTTISQTMAMKKKIKNYLQSKVFSFCAVVLYLTGKKPSCSTYIDEVSITAGYGQLNDFGDFQYPLPKKYVKEQFKGCLKWKDYLAKCE